MNYTLRSGFIEPEKTERGYKILASTTTVISGDRVFEIETGISIDLPKDYIGYLVHNKTRDIYLEVVNILCAYTRISQFMDSNNDVKKSCAGIQPVASAG